MPFFCSCYPLGSHRPPCPLANDGTITFTTTGTDSPDLVKESPTAIPAFTCIECGAYIMSVCNGRCVACSSGEPARPTGSWICARCGVSNAPHVDQCTCPAEHVANEPVIMIPSIFSVDPPLEPADFTVTTDLKRPPNTCAFTLPNDEITRYFTETN